jgi:hypothetical protein
MAVKILVDVLWVVTPYSDVLGYQRFRGACFLQFHPEDGGNKVHSEDGGSKAYSDDGGNKVHPEDRGSNVLRNLGVLPHY